MATAADVKRAVDIVDVVGTYLRLVPAGSQFKGLCPFHDDHAPSLVVDPRYQNYRCWACGASGDVFTFLQSMDRVSFVEALERLAERAGLTLSVDRAKKTHSTQPLYETLAWAQKLFHKFLFESAPAAEARQYLDQRGLTEQTARDYGLGFAPDVREWLVHQATLARMPLARLLAAGLVKKDENRGADAVRDVFRGRLLFPIQDERGRPVGFGGRLLPRIEAHGIGPKYLNTPATEVYQKSKLLYGYDVAQKALAASRPGQGQPRRLVIMEGYTDCLMAYQAGMLNAVATCGTALTEQHVIRLARLADIVVLMFDGDAAGNKGAWSAVKLLLGSSVDLRLCTLPEGQDPCDFIRARGLEPLQRIMDGAVDALDYLIDQARREMAAATSLEGRTRALDRVLEVLAEAAPEAARETGVKYNLALSRLVSMTGIQEAALRARLAGLRKTGRPTAPADAAALLAKAEPMNPREKQFVQWLVCRPTLANELLELYPTNRIRHPVLRRLAEKCLALCEDLGPSATVDALRATLDDPILDGQVVEFTLAAPADEVFEQGLADIKGALTDWNGREARRQERSALHPDADMDAHLALLKQARDARHKA